MLVAQSALAEDIASRWIGGEEIGWLKQTVRYDGIWSLLVAIHRRDLADVRHRRLKLGKVEVIGVLLELGRVVVLILNGDRQSGLRSPGFVCRYNLQSSGR